jgi:transketolase
MKYDNLAVGVLRGLSLDMITKAKSGHPGICLSLSPLVYTLFTRHLVADPSDPTWANRDRFVLSCGHASAMMYALLHLAGYAIPLEQLKSFRQLDSLTPGHPEYGHTPGIDATAGPLGQGISQAVGMAIAESHLQALYPQGQRIVNHYTYCVCGDGCLEEGLSQEAISLAGLFRLNKLILLYDRNDCTLDGPLSNSSVEDVKGRFIASRWNVLEVQDGNNLEAIDKAIGLAKQAKDKPTLIISHSVIGFGSPYAGSHVSHGKAFSADEVISWL